jgi:eukaryotic-like serine/threonine-protein kinase
MSPTPIHVFHNTPPPAANLPNKRSLEQPLATEQAGSADGAEDPRVTQALEEYLAALEAGQVPDRTQLLARYSDVADVLGGYLDGLDFLHRTVVGMHAGAAGTAPAAGPVPFLEDYEIVREVGRGGMGIVYEAVQRSLRRRVALKVLSLGATLDPRHLQRFKNESQAAAQLQHPNIVPVFAVGSERGVHYYAMHFVEGKPLSQVIRELRGGSGNAVPGPATDTMQAHRTDEQPAGGDDRSASRPPASLPPLTLPRLPIRDEAFFREAAWIGVQAAEALEHAHQMGVIHRDVKPANLLLDGEGCLWVTDFGLARWSAEDLTMTGDVVGTLRYMSPEQASARRGLVDHRTDVYSLGATLYEMLTLQPVAHGDDRQELLHQILHEDPVPPRRLCSDIPRDLETILLKALGQRVEERYATAQELADDLGRFLEGRPVLARRPSAWDRAGKWARRHRPVVVSAAALMALSVLGLIAGSVVILDERTRTQAAYEKEAEAHRLEVEARAKEAEARARAEQNFQQARQLLDYVAEIAVADMGAESDLPNVRRKLLQAALAYYKDFLEQQKDNELTRGELLRGYTRVAALLDASGRRADAEVVWNQAFQIALTFGDGEATFHLVPSNTRLRLLRLASVQEDLKLSPQQVRGVLDLESKRNEPRREKTGPRDEGTHAPNDRGEALEKEAVGLLSPEQARRLEQLRLQQLGAWAFQESTVCDTLKLTPEQRETLASLEKENEATHRPPGAAADRRDRQPLDRVLRLLTEEQRSVWKGLVGEPFAGVLPPPDVALSLGRMVLNVSPAGASRDQKKAAGGRHSTEQQAP